jgi:hypothetical protein
VVSVPSDDTPGVELRHPNIVATLTYAVRQPEQPPPAAVTVSTGSASAAAAITAPEPAPLPASCSKPCSKLEFGARGVGAVGEVYVSKQEAATEPTSFEILAPRRNNKESPHSQLQPILDTSGHGTGGGSGPGALGDRVAAAAAAGGCPLRTVERTGADGGEDSLNQSTPGTALAGAALLPHLSPEAQGRGEAGGAACEAFPIMQVIGSHWSGMDGPLLSQPHSSALGPVLGHRSGNGCGMRGSDSARDWPYAARMRDTWLVLEYCDRGSLQDAVDSGWFRDDPSSFAGRPRMPAIIATACEVSAWAWVMLRGDVRNSMALLKACTTKMRMRLQASLLKPDTIRVMAHQGCSTCLGPGQLAHSTELLPGNNLDEVESCVVVTIPITDNAGTHHKASALAKTVRDLSVCPRTAFQGLPDILWLKSLVRPGLRCKLAC